MELSTAQIIIAIAIFLIITVALIRTTYNHFRQETGARFWNTTGGKTNYLRVLVLLSMGITVIVMLIITGFGSFGK